MVTIAELRARHNKMTQAQLAKLLGVSQMTVSHMERNQLSIRGDKLVKLAKIFNVNTDELLKVD
ncbi:helix-turn-helix domain-containing protein [Streptococcus panodentis]|uniref:XRE family transcriptional regulator n=1 Tax=Streptococcus panodentis TaxID=1581472 RepID=A0ABS5AV94_9STRE|nr:MULTISPECIES: helix-turn-helix transcriptional regulator [Streptococcus]KXT83174.1 Cro family transcriptional repressor [Streptococcus sp. DD11]MBP2620487.1 XRE family transcriptional regulator [Streptococcus panodentis]